MAAVRWGIIGCGNVTEVKSGPAFQKADGSSLLAVMRRTGRLAEDYARRHGVPRWHDDADAIIESPDIDAVYVATHPDTHHDYVLRCARAGKPVYVEKPMAMTHGQCLEMVEACEAAGVPLWVGYYRRALPRFLAVHELVHEGAIGEVLAVHTTRYQRPVAAREGSLPWQADPLLSKGGLFFDSACHTFDFLDMLFGAVTAVAGTTASNDPAYAAPDTVCASLRFESGVVGSGLWCYAADSDLDRTVLYGSGGRISFSTFRAEPIAVMRGDAVETVDVQDPPHVHQPLVQTIVDELNGDGRCPSTGATAARTAWVMDEILSS